MSVQARQHNLADWLALHELEPQVCRDILAAAARINACQASEVADAPARPLALATGWSTVVAAICRRFPEQREIVEDAFAKTIIRTVDGARRRALTLHTGSYPVIVHGFSGSSPDLLSMAHEFAHALQLMVSGAKPVSPVLREICAFIGESALLSSAKDACFEHYPALVATWRTDERKYLIQDGKRLQDALGDPGAVYDYRWNYPLARHLACEICGAWPPARQWTLFSGELSLRAVLDDLQ